MSKLSLFLAKQKAKQAKPTKPTADSSTAATDPWLSTSTLKAETADAVGGGKATELSSWGDADDDTASHDIVSSTLGDVQAADLQGSQLKQIQQSVAAAKEEATVGPTPKDKTVKSWGKILITEGGVLLSSESASAAARTAGGSTAAAEADSGTTSATTNYAAIAGALSDTATSTSEPQATEPVTAASTSTTTGPKRYVPPSQRAAGSTQRRGPVKHVEPLKMEDATEFPDLGGATTPTTAAAQDAAKIVRPPPQKSSTPVISAKTTSTVGDLNTTTAAATTAAATTAAATTAAATTAAATTAAATAAGTGEGATTGAVSEVNGDDVSAAKEVAEGGGEVLLQSTKSVNAVDVLMASLRSLPVREAVAVVDVEGVMIKFKNRPRTVATIVAR